jgi:hypothetical protein
MKLVPPSLPSCSLPTYLPHRTHAFWTVKKATANIAGPRIGSDVNPTCLDCIAYAAAAASPGRTGPADGPSGRAGGRAGERLTYDPPAPLVPVPAQAKACGSRSLPPSGQKGAPSRRPVAGALAGIDADSERIRASSDCDSRMHVA